MHSLNLDPLSAIIPLNARMAVGEAPLQVTQRSGSVQPAAAAFGGELGVERLKVNYYRELVRLCRELVVEGVG